MSKTFSRERLFEIVEKDTCGDKASKAYDWLMLAAIILSVVPMFFKEHYFVFYFFEFGTLCLFLFDYFARWATADYYLKKPTAVAMTTYPFTLYAILDLLSILPSLYLLDPTFRILRISRLFKLLRILRFVQYSSHLQTLTNVLRNERGVLTSVLFIALSYILVTALIMFNVEPDSFSSFFMALYWATTALTTVGYGDIYPVTDVGRIISMISSLFGVAIIALPSGIITAGYMDEIKNKKHK